MCTGSHWQRDASSNPLRNTSVQVRFPPTVALTPVVARILGKESGDEEQPGA